MQYRREIDGLRAVAVLPVIFFHAGVEFFSGGYIGVDVFFVISGYLITTIILAEKQAGQFTLANFYERRARRILPALFVVMFVSIPFAWLWMMPSELKEFSESIVAVTFFSSNIFFWLQSGYFDVAAELKPLLHTWSLAIEEQYYLLFPLFVLFTWRFGIRTLFWSLSAIGFSSLLYAHWGAAVLPGATFFLLPTRLWELLIGSLLAIYLIDSIRAQLVSEHLSRWLREGLAASGLLLVVYATVAFDERTPFPSIYALAPTTGTAMVILFASARTVTGALLGNRVFVGIGLISYSAYLWHQPLFAFGRLSTVGEPRDELMLLLAALALVLSYFTWRYVEKPFRNKQLLSRRTIFQGALAVTMAFGLTGFAGHQNGGDISRYAEHQLRMLTKIEQLRRERRALIGSNVCHFTNENGRGLEDFLQNWNCWSDDSQLHKIPVIVVGDSHAADIAAALKTNGYLPLQISGTGCSLSPDFMTAACLRIFTKLFDTVHDNPDFDHIVLANRFSKSELSVQSISDMVNYWEKFGLEIAVFTGMPMFVGFEKALLLSKPVIPDFELSEYSERPELLELFAERGIHAINRKDIFCSLSSNCDFRSDTGELLLIDYDHFAPAGAKRFGKQLLKLDSLFSSIESVDITPTR